MNHVCALARVVPRSKPTKGWNVNPNIQIGKNVYCQNVFILPYKDNGISLHLLEDFINRAYIDKIYMLKCIDDDLLVNLLDRRLYTVTFSPSSIGFS